ncbi:CLUMA_CG012664, isoform A [Clunio marinus]|uniref:CLUMA_CG012664, isoform A n=1 Tax=Clunio marinus TaxID=568069 RepID=A0A1J1II83_9DIPT|nr:CLUMA_CG012664, isoform A [Clunio marinus]
MSLTSKTKDSQWLQLDVCQDFLQNTCALGEFGCPNAHPNRNVDIIDGKVTTCYDSFKGKCTRGFCKYYHPSALVIEKLQLKGHAVLAQRNAFAFHAPVVPQMFIPFHTEVPILIPQEPSGSSLGMNKVEIGVKRSADAMDLNLERYCPIMYCKRAAIQVPPFIPTAPYQMVSFPVPAELIPLNASFVNYTDSNGQLLDNLPVCQDFNRNMCTRINCKFVHLSEPKKLEIHEQRVAVCRDHANGICRRQQCKYYHIPIQLPSAEEMATKIVHSKN